MNLCFALPHLAQGMPPFGKEPAEQGSKPKRFLDQRLHDPSAKRRAPHKIFGHEPAESEVGAGSQSVRTWSGGSASSSSQSQKRQFPFQDESEEPDSGTTPLPFQDEGEETFGGGRGSSSDEEQFDRKGTSIFAMGWEAMQKFVAGHFWKEKGAEHNPEQKPKRAYDNSKRSAEAAYKKKGGVYKANGIDPNRLAKLFNTTACQCASEFVQNPVFAHLPA